MIDALLARDLQPWLCLYHWDLPQALQDQGGWASRDIAGRFADYAAAVTRAFGDRIAAFATFNEPNVFVLAGHATGTHAPGLRNMATASAAMHHVNLAHGDAVVAIRAAGGTKIGAIFNQRPIRPATPTRADRQAAASFDALWNRAWADPIVHGCYPQAIVPLVTPFLRDGDMARIWQKVDYFGLNHYCPFYVRHDPTSAGGVAVCPPPAGVPINHMGWEISPAAFRETIDDVAAHYPGLPIYITENGIGLDEPDGPDALLDSLRCDYIDSYLGALAEARAGGADVRGYFHWSLLDNFEWAFGYAKRFGLVRIDYASLERRPKRSFERYRAWVAKGAP